MQVRLKTLMAGPTGCFQPGATPDLDEKTARDLIEHGFAEPIGAAAAEAEMGPGPETQAPAEAGAGEEDADAAGEPAPAEEEAPSEAPAKPEKRKPVRNKG